MNGPRKKEDVELAWSAVKRAVTARVSYEAQVWRERRLNEQLHEAWREFQKRLADGDLPVADELDSLGPGGGA